MQWILRRMVETRKGKMVELVFSCIIDLVIYHCLYINFSRFLGQVHKSHRKQERRYSISCAKTEFTYSGFLLFVSSLCKHPTTGAHLLAVVFNTTVRRGEHNSKNDNPQTPSQWRWLLQCLEATSSLVRDQQLPPTEPEPPRPTRPQSQHQQHWTTEQRSSRHHHLHHNLTTTPPNQAPISKNRLLSQIPLHDQPRTRHIRSHLRTPRIPRRRLH